MPFCHRHPNVPVITDQLGVARCRVCDGEARAAAFGRCLQCARPVDRPGLCRSCAARARREQGVDWLGSHMYTVMLLLAALLAIGTYIAIKIYLVPAFKQIEEAPAYRIGRAP
jgi:hypothetical protein